MTYFPIIANTDNRRSKQGCTPLVTRNCLVERAPLGAGRGNGFFIGPAPGRTRVATLQTLCRGLFSEPGCRESKLFAPAGAYFNEVSSTYSYASVGSLTGADVMQMVSFRAAIAALSAGSIHHWDGSSFSTVADGDAPNPASTLSAVALRLIAAAQDGDAFGWSKAGLYNDWDPSGAAADIYLPDPIVGQYEIDGELWSFGARSTTPWQPTGGAEAEAFAIIPGTTFRIGLAARDAFARTSEGGMLLGHDRRVYKAGRGGLVPVVNRDLEIALRDLSAADIAADARAFSYRIGSKEFWGLSCGLERAFIYDLELGLWHERARQDVAVYDVDFAATAFDESDVIVAGAASSYLWKLEPAVYSDDGDEILREMTLHIPVNGDATLDRIVLDIEVFDQPLIGQGSEPEIMLEVSTNNGQTWSDERVLSMPADGQRFRVQDFAFGMMETEAGALIRARISDPVGFALYGAYVNPSPEEIP